MRLAKILAIVVSCLVMAICGGQNAKAEAPCYTTLIGDLNNDCKVDFQDFVLMAEHWMIDCNLDPFNFACSGIITTHSITATADANGLIDPNGVIIKNHGDSLTLTAAPNPGYEVDKWTLDGIEAQVGGNTFTLYNITIDHIILVHFKSLQIITSYTIFPAADTGGSIDPNGVIIKNQGENLTLTATPATDYEVDKWILDDIEAQVGGDTFTLSNITSGHRIIVSFKLASSVTYTITAATDANGLVDPCGVIIKNQGEILTLTATPAPSYAVDKWILDGIEAQVGGYTFILPNITADHTVAVSFKLVSTASIITATADANGLIDPNGAIIKNPGESLTLTATPDPGYAVDKWILDGSEMQTGGNIFLLFNITADHTVAVSFKSLPTVTIAASDSNDHDKAIADIVCPGTSDHIAINAAIVTRNNAGGGTIHCLPGTYKIKFAVYFGDNTANIVFRGSGPSTVFEKETVAGTMSGAPVAEDSFSTLTATTGVFTPDMVGKVIQFDTSNMTYHVKSYVSPTQLNIGASTGQSVAGGTNDASGETPGDTFRIGDVYHVVYQQNKGHHLKFQNFQIDGKNFGYNLYAGNKGLFINGNYTDYSKCHHIYIENVFAKNTTAEAICIDYSQYGYITDCNTENSAWAGCTLAQVKYGAIQRCHILNSGTANCVDSLGAGVNCQNVEQGLIADNFIDTPHDIGLAVATQELMAPTYRSLYVTVRNNTIVNTNNIGATSVILIYRTQGSNASVLNSYIDIIGNHISGDVGNYHGILINNSQHLNVLDNNVLGRGTGKYGIYFGNKVNDAHYDGNTEKSSYAWAVLVDTGATNIVAGTNFIVP